MRLHQALPDHPALDDLRQERPHPNRTERSTECTKLPRTQKTASVCAGRAMLFGHPAFAVDAEALVRAMPGSNVKRVLQNWQRKRQLVNHQTSRSF